MGHAALLRSTTLALTGALASLTLSACNKPAPPTQDASLAAAIDTTAAPLAGAPAGALAPTDTSPAAPAAEAPAADALAPAPPAPVAAPPPPAQQYRYIDQAASLSAAFADTPPDYTVDYQGTRPWIWRSGDGAYRIVEAAPGGERYFYFMPGAATPFLVRDSNYTYAYDQGRLVVVYAADGRPLAPTLAARQVALAGRYLARARGLYSAALHEKRQAAHAANWQARRAPILAQQQQWRQQQQANQQWRAWHDQHAAAGQAKLDRERTQRQAYAAQLASVAAPVARGPDQTGVAVARQRQAKAVAAQPGPTSARARNIAHARAAQAEVDAARQNLARARAQTAGADQASKAKIMDAARTRLRLALQKQAAA